MQHVSTTMVLVILAGVLIAHLTALVSNTKRIPAWAGGYVSLVLSAATGFLSEWAQSPDNYDWRQGALRALIALGSTIGAHFGIVNKTPVQGKLLDFGASRANRRGAKSATDSGPYEIEPEHEAEHAA